MENLSNGINWSLIRFVATAYNNVFLSFAQQNELSENKGVIFLSLQAIRFTVAFL